MRLIDQKVREPRKESSPRGSLRCVDRIRSRHHDVTGRHESSRVLFAVESSGDSPDPRSHRVPPDDALSLEDTERLEL